MLICEVNLGSGDGDGDEEEWVRDNGAGFHMARDKTIFDIISLTPPTFFVRHIKGKV